MNKNGVFLMWVGIILRHKSSCEYMKYWNKGRLHMHVNVKYFMSITTGMQRMDGSKNHFEMCFLVISVQSRVTCSFF